MAAMITNERIGEILKTALSLISNNGGWMPSREVVKTLSLNLNFTEYEKGILEKTGNIRWQSLLHFYSIDLQKAGWLQKKNGVWYITETGADNLSLSPLDFLNKAREAYKLWKKNSQRDLEKAGVNLDKNGDIEESEDRIRVIDYEQVQDLSKKKLSDFINSVDPYIFQDMVAALLRGMGYHTPFVAPRGKDGGIDIIAYRDPLGVQPPRMKIQVKHRINTKATPQEIQQLIGLLNEDDIGLFVSTGGFTPDALSAIRNSKKHMEKIDIDSFIDLWTEYYDKLNEEDKLLLPLRKVYILAPEE